MEGQKLIRIAYKLRIVKKHGEQPYLIDISNFISRVVEYAYIDNPRYPIKYAKTAQYPINMRGLLPKEILRILKHTSRGKKQKAAHQASNEKSDKKKKASTIKERQLTQAEQEALKQFRLNTIKNAIYQI